jgi:hypothetical protein
MAAFQALCIAIMIVGLRVLHGCRVLVGITAGEAPAALRRQLELLYQSILVVVMGGEACTVLFCSVTAASFSTCLHVRHGCFQFLLGHPCCISATSSQTNSRAEVPEVLCR